MSISIALGDCKEKAMESLTTDLEDFENSETASFVSWNFLLFDLFHSDFPY